MDFAPVFLICSERSGSNLIRVMMDAHPDVVAPPPLHFLRDVIGHLDMVVADGKASPAWSILRSRLSKAIARHYDEAFSREIVGRVDRLAEPSAAAIIETVYETIVEQAGAKVLFVKENGIHRSAFALMHTFPGARFIFQVRDPRDYLASATKLRKQLFGNKFGSTRRAIELWRQDQETGLSALGQLGPGRVFLQRYEDLIEEPRKVLEALCAFLGIAFDERMLEYHSLESTEKFARKGEQWKNLSKAVMASNKGNYRQSLSAWQIKCVEACLGPLMERFGYQRDHQDSKLRHVLWPMIIEPVERYFNRELGPFYTEGSRQHAEEVAAVSDRLPLAYESAKTHTPLAALERVLRAAQSHPSLPALAVDGETWTYSDLLDAASAIEGNIDGTSAVIGVYASRHWSAYAGVLAALLRNSPFVPLNPRFPDERNQVILRRSGITHIVCREADREQVERLIGGPDGFAVTVLAMPDEKREYEGSSLAERAREPRSLKMTGSHPEDIAYILFTSGSTGMPKGVPISHGNLGAYLDQALKLLQPIAGDRFSHTFELSFDLSIHDMLVCWSSGACLFVASLDDLRQPAAYIRRHELTQWFSVPSLAYQMRLQGSLTPGAFPSLRTSLFCGEALPFDLAADWRRATPNGRVENWYGPTEATIACTRHILQARGGADDDTVPIGRPFANMRALVLRDDLTQAPPGETGELFLAGPQLAPGYLEDDERTARSFLPIPGEEEIFYRTGDRVVSRGGLLHFLGRVDNQVKIRGHRVELSEVEGALRKSTGGHNCVALSWPPEKPSGEFIVAAIEGAQRDIGALLKGVRHALPDYMVPSTLFFFDRFPTNASGKADRSAISKEIAERILASRTDRSGHSSVSEQLMNAVREINPSLSSERILGAESLIDAGMDSFGFVRLTMELEERFGLNLDQEKVADLSLLPFGDLVAFIASSSGDFPLPNGMQRRANRAIQFIEKLPFLLRQEGLPPTLAIGSSGVFRGFSVDVYDRLSIEAGCPARSVNAGLPAISCKGMAEICAHIRELCRREGVRLPTVIYELDPMHVSTLPPKGDISLDEDVFSGKARSAPRGTLHPEFEWSQKRRGSVLFDTQITEKRRRPKWSKARDQEIADTYAGRVAFDSEALEHWIAGAEALSDTTENLVAFIHPLAGHEELSTEPDETNQFVAMIEEVKTRLGIRLATPDNFRIAKEHFLNINHVDPWEGARALTSQLFHWMSARSLRSAAE